MSTFLRPERITVLHNTDYDAELTAGTGTDVSSVLASCRAIAAALREAGFSVDMMGIEGRDVITVVPALATSGTQLVFNLCESMGGDSRNEPTICGMMDLFGIRYTGSDGLALGACLHKPRAKDILHGRRVATPPHRVWSHPDQLTDPTLEQLDYPWFLKLVHEDASVGITEQNRVNNAAELRARAATMIREYDQPVLGERFIEGREINVTILGKPEGGFEVMPLYEIDFAAMPADRPRIVSYAAKWEESHVDYLGTKPVPLRAATPEFIARVQDTAMQAWLALGLRDYGRVDLRVDAANQPWVIDVNPNCDISPDAGAARAAAAAGLPFPQMLERIVLAAYNRPARNH